MKKKLNCILLVDDEKGANHFHQIMIEEMDYAEKVYLAYDGKEALEFLESALAGALPLPKLIFLDINMPGMNGWDFLHEYEKMDTAIKDKIVVVMLTSSINHDDMEKAKQFKSVIGFKNKYLEKEAMNELFAEHFPEYF